LDATARAIKSDVVFRVAIGYITLRDLGVLEMFSKSSLALDTTFTCIDIVTLITQGKDWQNTYQKRNMAYLIGSAINYGSSE
jgi:hypothetical protein